MDIIKPPKPKVEYQRLVEFLELKATCAANDKLQHADGLEGLAKAVAITTKDYVSRRLSPIEARLSALETKLKILETMP